MKLRSYPGNHQGPDVAGGVQREAWWMQEALAWETETDWTTPLKAQTGAQRADVVVVGGGYTGLWAALALLNRDPSLDVVLTEQHICGYGASGRNGGLVSGYWRYLPALVSQFGNQGALDMALAGAAAQDGIAGVAKDCGLDLWWRDTGHLKVATSGQQIPSLDAIAAEAQRLGQPDQVRRVSADEVARVCNAERFTEGLMFAEGAMVQPARLARGLRDQAIQSGGQVYEHTTVTSVEDRSHGRLRVITERGHIDCSDVILATNAALSRNRLVRRHVTPFSSHIALTAPVPKLLESSGWTSGMGIFDTMMFPHYFRTTPDGRIAMGSGSGAIGNYGQMTDRLFSDDAAVFRAQEGLRRFFPGSETTVSHSWGGPIDISADKLPFFGSDPRRRVHFAAGFSGHGVNPAWIAGQTLASFALNANDHWTELPFADRQVPGFPPEPARTWGAQAIRSAIIRTEEAQQDERRTKRIDLALGAVPRVLGMTLGTR